MEISNLITHIEALIFASEKPLTAMDIVELVNNAFGFMEDKVTLDQVETAIEGIHEKYAAEFYPFEIRQSGGGWQFLTKREVHPYLETKVLCIWKVPLQGFLKLSAHRAGLPRKEVSFILCPRPPPTRLGT